MKTKILKLALIGKTNVGKSTLINSFVGEKISIINRKINTTQDLILGIKNYDKIQIIFYDTPGSNFLKSNDLLQKKLKTNIWEAIDNVDILVYIVDVNKYNFLEIKKDILKISEVNKEIIFVFNKIDIFDNKKILFFIDQLKNIKMIDSFFNISAKYNTGVQLLSDYLLSKSYFSSWIFQDNEISNKDDIYISNECTRNALLTFLHKEIPYNLMIENTLFKYLKNGDLKIKQNILISNNRYKPIILGKKGVTIKKVREKSQIEIKHIFNSKTHLYLQVKVSNNE